MNKSTVERLMKEYDEWSIALYCSRLDKENELSQEEKDRIERRWREYRQKIFNHLLRAPGRGPIPEEEPVVGLGSGPHCPVCGASQPTFNFNALQCSRCGWDDQHPQASRNQEL